MKQLFLTLICLVLSSWAVGQDARTRGSGSGTGSEQQGRTLTGRVLDDSGQPVESATIQILDASGKAIAQSITDATGNFSITAQIGQGFSLRASYLGKQIRVIQITGANRYDVVLSGDISAGPIVVTAGNIRRAPDEIGYAYTTVDQTSLVQARRSNVLDAISSKVPGVQINRGTGGVNSSSRILLRGTRSFLGNNQPLIVVDGVFLSNDDGQANTGSTRIATSGNRLNDINPDDIESLTILTGSEGSIIYGTRGANGVIIITTKKGASAQGIEVTYTGGVSFSSPLKLPELQEDFGTGFGLSATTFDPGYDAGENWKYGPRYDGQPAQIGPILSDLSAQILPYEFNDEFLTSYFKTGVTYNNSIAISGSRENTSFRVSAQHVREEGIQYEDQFGRYVFSAAFETKLASWVNVGARVTYNRNLTDVTFAGGLNGNNTQAYQAVFNSATVLRLGDYRDITGNKFATNDGWFGQYYDNPFQLISNNRYESVLNRVNGAVEATFKATEWLSFVTRFGVDAYSDFTLQREDQINYNDLPEGLPQDTLGGFADNSTFNANRSAAYAGFATTTEISYSEFTSEAQALIKKSFGEFDLNLVAGYQYFQIQRFLSSLSANALNAPGNFNPVNNRVGELTGQYNKSVFRKGGGYIDGTIGYKKYLYLGASARLESTSLLDADNNDYFFWGLNASFLPSTLLGWDEDNFVNRLKVRVAYSSVGNDASIAPYTLPEADLVTPSGFPYGSQTAVAISNQLPDENIEPEITSGFDAGVEITFFKSRISLGVSVYDKSTTDISTPALVSATTGYSSYFTSIGEVSNQGIELTAQVAVFENPEGFSWDFNGNFTTNSSEVVEIAPGLDFLNISSGGSAQVAAVVGEQFPVFRGNATLLDPDGNVVVGADGVPLVDPTQRILGQINPKFTVGLGSVFSYKNFSLSMQWDIRSGNVFNSQLRSDMLFTGISKETAEYDRQPIIWPGSVQQVETAPNVFEFVPNTVAITTDDHLYANANYRNLADQANIVDADFIRLREVVFTYKLPNTLLDNTFFKSVSFSVIATNLLLITAEENEFSDPEVSGFGTGNAIGFDFSNLPSARSVGGSVSVTF